MRSHKGNEKGMTLVEILAALVILGIVFVAFMTIFPQMTNFNSKTYTKLESMNLARATLNSLNRLPAENECNELIENKTKCIIFDKSNPDYDILITYSLSPEKSLNSNTQKFKGQSNLYKVDVQYFRKGKNKILSEIFGYLKVEIAENGK